MNYYLKLFLFFVVFINSVDDQIQQEEREKEAKKSKDKEFKNEKIPISHDMTHPLLFIFGLRHEVQNNLYLFCCLNTALYSSIYKDEVPKDEYQWSFFRTAHLELGLSYEFLPFWGGSVSLYSQEFFNGGASKNKLISGLRLSIFYHYGSWYIESGLVVKENMKGILGEKNNYGFSFVFSVKFIKNSVYFGGAILL